MTKTIQRNLLRAAGLVLVAAAVFGLAAVWRRAELTEDSLRWVVVIPPWLIAAAAAAGLYALGAWRAQEKGLSLLPAAALGAIWLFLSRTPVGWGTMVSATWQRVPAVSLVLTVYFLVESIRALAAGRCGFDAREALLAVGMMAVSGLSLAGYGVQSALLAAMSTQAGPQSGMLLAGQIALYALAVLGGLAALPYARRSGNPWGWALVVLGVAGVALYGVAVFMPQVPLGIVRAAVQDPIALSGFSALVVLGVRTAQSARAA